MPDPKTEELRIEQIQRARREHEQAGEATEAAEERTHSRRADRAAAWPLPDGGPLRRITSAGS